MFEQGMCLARFFILLPFRRRSRHCPSPRFLRENGDFLLGVGHGVFTPCAWGVTYIAKNTVYDE